MDINLTTKNDKKTYIWLI